MDVLVEAIAKIKSACSKEKELCRKDKVALQVVLETARTLMSKVCIYICKFIAYPSNFLIKDTKYKFFYYVIHIVGLRAATV